MKSIIFKRSKSIIMLGKRNISIDILKENIEKTQNKFYEIFGVGIPISYNPHNSIIDNGFKNILDIMTVDKRSIVARLISFSENEIEIMPEKEEYIELLEDLKEKDYELKLRAIGSKNKNDNNIRIIAFDLVRYVNYNR